MEQPTADYRPRLPKAWEPMIEEMKGMTTDEVLEVTKIIRQKNNSKPLLLSESASSLEELFEMYGLNQNEWVVSKATINQYPTTLKVGEEIVQVANPQIKADIRPLVDTSSVKDLLESLANEYSMRGPTLPLIKRDRTTIHQTLQLMLVDHHLGKLPADGTYSLEEASDLYMEVVHEAISRTKTEQIHEIVLVMGNDFLHVDNIHSQTTSGTQIESNEAWNHLFRSGVMLQVRAIDTLKQIAPVRVIPVPGNHDWHSIFSMAFALEAWYRNDDNVSVDPPKLFQYWTDGTSLVGLTHGNIKPTQLPLIMARERKDFHAARVMHWHIGHYHSEKVKTTPIFPSRVEEGGVVIRTFPALCPADSWHKKHGWHLSARNSIQLLWERDKGLVGEFPIVPASLL